MFATRETTKTPSVGRAIDAYSISQMSGRAQSTVRRRSKQSMCDCVHSPPTRIHVKPGDAYRVARGRSSLVLYWLLGSLGRSRRSLGYSPAVRLHVNLSHLRGAKRNIRTLAFGLASGGLIALLASTLRSCASGWGRRQGKNTRGARDAYRERRNKLRLHWFQ